jgi:hypothetical protein
MATIEREVYGRFVRLDRADPELSTVEHLEVYSLAAKAKSRLAQTLLLDPLQVLIDHPDIGGITDEWQVTVNRVNAEVAIPPNPGVHHIIIIIVVIRASKHAHGIYYRMPPPDDPKKAKKGR